MIQCSSPIEFFLQLNLYMGTSNVSLYLVERGEELMAEKSAKDIAMDLSAYKEEMNEDELNGLPSVDELLKKL